MASRKESQKLGAPLTPTEHRAHAIITHNPGISIRSLAAQLFGNHEKSAIGNASRIIRSIDAKTRLIQRTKAGRRYISFSIAPPKR